MLLLVVVRNNSHCIPSGMVMISSGDLEEGLNGNVIHLVHDLVSLDEISADSSFYKSGMVRATFTRFSSYDPLRPDSDT